MFTRRTATVTMSAPDASCACTMTAGERVLAGADDEPRGEGPAGDGEGVHIANPDRESRIAALASRRRRSSRSRPRRRRARSSSSNAARLSTTRLCSTATRRGSMSSRASRSPTVSGPATSNGSPFSCDRHRDGQSGLHCITIRDQCLFRRPATLGARPRRRDRLVSRATARARARSSTLLRRGAYYSRPIALRHPIVFYEGHLPASASTRS